VKAALAVAQVGFGLLAILGILLQTPKATGLGGTIGGGGDMGGGYRRRRGLELSAHADRLRGQLTHADRILTGTLEAVEDAGSKFSHSFWRPVQKASALVQGIKVGLDLLRSRRRRRNSDDPREQQEEELFI